MDQKFETESREIFHQRDQIVAEAGLKPGTTMADIGAGTGLFTLQFPKSVLKENYFVKFKRK